MCACDVGFVCSRCEQTPFDDAYQEQEDERELSLAAFDRLASEASDG